jgi:hypothetical protein
LEVGSWEIKHRSWKLEVGKSSNFFTDLPFSDYNLRIMIMTFEDLETWQKARQVVRKIYDLTRAEILCRDFGICGQVQRAGVSVMSNIGSAL